MERRRAAVTYEAGLGELVSAAIELSPRKRRMVTLYARNLKDRPFSDTGRRYIAMLLEEGAGSDEILAAAQAIHDVDYRLAREAGSRAGLDALHQRTEEHFYHWCRERGIDYETLSEKEFGELVEGAIRQVREVR